MSAPGSLAAGSGAAAARAPDATTPGTAGAAAARAGLAFVAIGLAGEIALHVIEPDLGMTWGYAHLGRYAAFPVLALALAAALPAAGARIARDPRWRRPPLAPSWPQAIAAGTLVWVALAVIGWAVPAPALTLDSAYFRKAVANAATPADRWLDAVAAMRLAAHLRPAAMSIEAFVIVANAALSTAALLALVGCARLLARDRAEQLVVAALAWTAFGTMQLAVGYVDVYPFALAGTALFFWTALRALADEAAPAWAAAIAALGPFVYLGIVLLAPSALLLLALLAGAPGRRRSVLAAGVVAVVVAGVATVPLRGLPFDWIAFARAAHEGSAYQAGYSPTSSLLPVWYLTSGRHAAEVASTIVLVDPVGALLVAGAGGALLVSRPRALLEAPVALLVAFVAGWLAYVATMDAVFGAFADWDLFSYGAAGTSLLGAALLLRLGRDRRRALGATAGLALAAGIVHLLARLHALPVGAERHVRESPLHVAPAAAPSAAEPPPPARTP
ncbi:MAG TPA: hypothetical protein VFD92_15110 [Candidatus Binatia bacterium]|nr:hypothetical protein [Candidatus Binatia bacterium]